MSSITPINNVDGLGKIAKLAKSTNIIGEVSSFSSILDDALKQNKSTQVLTTNPIVPFLPKRNPINRGPLLTGANIYWQGQWVGGWASSPLEASPKLHWHLQWQFSWTRSCLL